MECRNSGPRHHHLLGTHSQASNYILRPTGSRMGSLELDARLFIDQFDGILQPANRSCYECSASWRLPFTATLPGTISRASSAYQLTDGSTANTRPEASPARSETRRLPSMAMPAAATAIATADETLTASSLPPSRRVTTHSSE